MALEPGPAAAADAEAPAAEAHASEGPEAELERQAQALAEKALEKLAPAARALKLPKVKEGILRRLREQLAQPSSAPQAQQQPQASQGATAPPPPPEGQAQPPPPPPLPVEHPRRAELEGVEACGDERWFSTLRVRRALRDSVVAGHAEQKILVGPPLEEMRRICPGGDRILGAGAVLRLGGSLLGGYGEGDIAYAYRQLSRALHPDKNQDVAEAPGAFKRLQEAAEELRQSLGEARTALHIVCAAMGRSLAIELLERPQEALFAEATRMLSAILAFSGEGEVPGPASSRGVAAFANCDAFAKCSGQGLLTEWYEQNRLIELFATACIRTAYDCSPKRFRAQFLCLLNRAALAEAKRQNDCVRGTWRVLMSQFPELGLWRDFLDRLKERVLRADDVDGDGALGDPWPDRPPRLPAQNQLQPKGPGLLRRDQSTKEGLKSDPVCWNFVTAGWCKQGDRCRYLHRYPPGYSVEKAAEAITRGRPRHIELASEDKPEPKPEPEPESKPKLKTSKWARRWREAFLAVFPVNTEAALPATDPEVRKLCVALWQDIGAWVKEGQVADPLALFTAEPSGRSDPTGGIHPGGPEMDWAFVPGSDLLLVVGDGIVGITCEGVMADGPSGYKRETFAEAFERLSSVRPAPAEEEEEEADHRSQTGNRSRRKRYADADQSGGWEGFWGKGSARWGWAAWGEGAAWDEQGHHEDRARSRSRRRR